MKNIIVLLMSVFSFTIAYAQDKNEYEFKTMLLDSCFSNHKIELLFEKPLAKQYQLLVLLHGSSSNGVKDISQSWFIHWLNKGYAIASISLPGYGGSTGNKDFCGPFTLASLHYAVEFIKQKLGVKDFGIIGFGQGGAAGVLLTSQRNDIRCLVCSNGGYDLLRHKVPNDLLMNTLKEKGYDLNTNDDEALKYRSPMQYICLINTPIFLLHRKGNPIINEGEASDFYNAMLKAGKNCHLTIKDRGLGDDAQILSQKEILAEAEDWIDQIMMP